MTNKRPRTPSADQAGPSKKQPRLDDDSRGERVHAGPFFNTSHTSDYGLVRNANGSIINNVTVHTSTERAKDIYLWLHAPDTSGNYNAAREKYQARTGSWFLTGMQYWLWKGNPNRPLWISGAPGCGKTVMCSSVIEDIAHLLEDNPDWASAYFFFDSRDGQIDLSTYDKMLRSLISQLPNREGGMPEPLEEIYGKKHHHPQPSIASLEKTLQKIIQNLEQTFIVLDALDECKRDDRGRLLNWVNDISSWHEGKLHLLISSRHEPDIDDRLRSLQCLSYLDFDQSPQNSDILRYIEVKISKMQGWKRKKVEIALVRGAGGMFRWVDLQIQGLDACLSEQDLDRQLQALPEGLEAAYKRLILQSRKPEDLTRLLQWLAFSTRPLNLSELTDVTAVNFPSVGPPVFDPTRRYMSDRDVLAICSGFVTEFNGTVKLAHMSVKDFLMSAGIKGGMAVRSNINEKLAHSMICQTCLVYLLELNILDSLLHHSFALTGYVIQHWITHFHAGDIACETSQTLLVRLFSSPEAFRNWARLQDAYALYPGNYLPVPSSVTGSSPIGYAARIDLHDTVGALLDSGADVNDCIGTRRPLLEASRAGLEAMVDLLLCRGADVNAQGPGKQTSALHAAASWGHINIVRLLIKKGAQTSALDANGWTVLQRASSLAHHEVIRTLLDAGAEVNASGKHGSALRIACCRGNPETVQLFLERGADPNISDNKGVTVLHIAASREHINIVRLLIKKGAQTSTLDADGWTVLQRASSLARHELIRTLLDAGAEVNASGKHGTALHAGAASQICSLETVKLLLERGADPDIPDDKGVTALQIAASREHIDIIRLLINKGAQTSTLDVDGWTVLQRASSLARHKLIRTLLDAGAEVNASGKHGSALHFACQMGKLKTVQLLLERGADATITDTEGITALHIASRLGHLTRVKVLLDRGAHVNSTTVTMVTALHEAAGDGHDDVVRLLLEKGAHVNAHDAGGWTPLQNASYRGLAFETTIPILLAAGADVNEQGGDGSALHISSCLEHIGNVFMLMEHGADVNAADEDGYTALASASSKGQVELVRVLTGPSVRLSARTLSQALACAEEAGQQTAVSLLLQKIHDLYGEGRDSHSCKMRAAASAGVSSLEVI